MVIRILFVSAALFLLAGCAAPLVAPLPDGQIWQDATFHYQPQRVSETRETFFHLDQAVADSIKAVERRGYTSDQRLDLLLSLLYGKDGIRFAYASGHSTGAAQTWRFWPRN